MMRGMTPEPSSLARDLDPHGADHALGVGAPQHRQPRRQPVAQKGVHLGNLLQRRGAAGANRPDRLIGNQTIG